jgi:hypothetical protein
MSGDTITVQVLRNRVELQTKKLDVSLLISLEQLHALIVSDVANESTYLLRVLKMEGNATQEAKERLQALGLPKGPL